MDMQTLYLLIEVVSLVVGFCCSVIALVIVVLRSKDTNKIATYQTKFKKLLADVSADGKITEEERKQLRDFFLSLVLECYKIPTDSEVDNNDV